MTQQNPRSEANEPAPKRPRVEIIDKDRVRIEFRIDDLLNLFAQQGVSRNAAASCAGCKSCNAE